MISREPQFHLCGLPHASMPFDWRHELKFNESNVLK